ncbi:F420-non-reducing hydrogenase iron-sulfur subunit MvhD [Archaeoglobus profundus]|uniref:F420-non-reducing hydrogenase iron-sulfur subunit D n=1 Tax=Archaeoglobus profundus (strain DSM 5631 / JCM 9629 / NBRC 100127 / Av18) TaxID=572546 RepID=VHCD_ARCPA|nr:F420-non-reducing hydrogenase iron-sulfur subunit MvhD [Archaeoglobus profundus]P84624.2 RecName: Full=F420-non-reducing hydrogenase iron-sulfur subunit D [Archaeoglobus profundus DSM 5631]ADB58598.1 methyl-viologen-reducing hydrogenase delta subunit [Archaeoglobus profundus DSM 5631]
MSEEWEPNIVCIACNWCTYQAADMAGSLRYSYPPTVKVVRVPCSGRVEPEFIVEALTNGADGVIVGGCHLGDCHYKEGNYKALRRFKLLHKLLTELGIEPERVRLEWISGSEGLKFAEVMTEFDATIRKLGPFKFER